MGLGFSVARKAPWGLIVMACLVGLIESGLKRRWPLPGDIAGANWRVAGREARRAFEENSILFLGTSLTKYGIVPWSIEETTGHPARNFAVMSGNMVTNAVILDRILSHGPSPRAIVVDCQDAPIPSEHWDKPLESIHSNLAYWPELLHWSEVASLVLKSQDLTLAGRFATSKWLTSFRSRGLLRRAISAAAREETENEEKSVLLAMRAWAGQRGGALLPPRDSRRPLPERDPNGFQGSAPVPLPRDNYKSNRLSQEYEARFFALAGRRGIPVYWLLPPISPLKSQERDGNGMTDFYTRRAASLQVRYPNVTIIDARATGYPAEYYHDPVHLNGLGACHLSVQVGAALAKSLARPVDPDNVGWITIGPADAPMSQLAARTYEASLK